LAPSTYYLPATVPTDRQQRLEHRIIALSQAYPRFGYRFIHALLCREGWRVNRKRVQRVRRQEGLGVRPHRKRNRRGRSTVAYPVQATYPQHVWSWDFILDRTEEGRPLKTLSVLDEYTRQCLALVPARTLTSQQVLDTLEHITQQYGTPAYIRSDNGSEFIAQLIRDWGLLTGVDTIYIDPGSPWQNGYIESFHSRFRDECLNREVLLSIPEAQVVFEAYRQFYNGERPHSSLGYRTPDEFAGMASPNTVQYSNSSHPK
jgi:transposase InsO family protein